MSRKLLPVGALAFLALALAACDQGPIGPDMEPQFAIDPDPAVPGGNLHPEAVFVCKHVDGGNGTFDFTATSTRNDLATWIPAFNLTGGQCRMIAQASGALFSVTVTEQAAAGFVLDSVIRYNAVFPNGNLPFQFSSLDKQKITNAASATGEASGFVQGTGLHGALIVFYNSAEPTTTGQGCTPGYWRQAHHFGNWPAPYLPGSSFHSTFGVDAFPGRSLGQVVALGGGGLNALGRHAVAALLNAAKFNDYGMSVGDVISGFVAAHSAEDYNTLKDIFEELNEQGCSLGRAE